MKVALRLLKEFWFPTVVAVAWTAYNVFADGSKVWGLREYVNVLGPSFFLVSYGTGQLFRVKKQEALEKELKDIKVSLENLTQANHNLVSMLQRFREEVAPEHRADPSSANKSTEVIPLSRVVEFYDLIARFYNKRNTGKYLATYVETYSAIRSSLTTLEGISVCDLGGGTGFLLQLFHQHGVRWTNVDFSSSSLSVFQRDFSFHSRKSLRTFNVCRDQFIKPGESFDVFVMSYLLSSLPYGHTPDFGQIGEAMNAQSLLVIADNHFAYVEKNPLYGYEGVEGRNVAIEPRPMHAEDLCGQVQDVGLVEIFHKVVSIGDEPYSQVYVFKKG